MNKPGGGREEIGYRSAEAWEKNSGIVQAFLTPGTNTLLDLCNLKPGQRVLDVAAGTGFQTFAIIQRVGESGHVLATDIAEDMVNTISAKAKAAGHTNIDAKVMDGENLTVDEGSFDAVVCQMGLMLFPDPNASLASMYKALRPGGRVAIMVFGSPAQNPHLSISGKIAREQLGLPPLKPGQPGHFSLGKSGLLESMMANAGFENIRVETVSTEMRPTSAADFVAFLRESGGGPSPMLAKTDEATRDAAWAAIAEALSEFDSETGSVFPGEILVTVGSRPL